MIPIGVSTSCVYPEGAERAFATAAELGYDGVEVMVTRDEVTRDAGALIALSDRYAVPILSVHAPVLLFTQFVWGRDPRVKLERSAGLARAVGAGTVVVHPPFRWQRAYAGRFLDVVAATADEYGVTVAVENMFPWTVRGRTISVYAPSWDPLELDSDAVTLDFSHAALSGRDGMELAAALGPRLRHVHLCDGPVATEEGTAFDEHLPPGAGSQPIAETLAWLAGSGWDGRIVAEVNTRHAADEHERLELLRSTLEFARRHTAVPAPAPEDGALR
ncbi:sugar phosphate isomerase/epimerase [Naasia sp. SYSU D00948]|uniref:sugar phosphate isomerase/epimerase family protein n=1 Tax=Naasia sp. SYSU D00948 TaxID=2817379 RepID=UPI001B308D84|nr:sugar phosphate isomerase/epimerase [Naasia sp. SYSU D00948]